MSKIFKPRRGTTYTMNSTDKKNTVLAKGEMFIEVPDTGVGTGASIMKLGDGTTTYENLPAAIDPGHAAVSTISSEKTAVAALADVVSGASTADLFGNLKQAVDKNRAAIADLGDGVDLSVIADEFSTSSNYAVGDYVTYQSGLYKCTTAHSAGAWNASDFTQTQVVDLAPNITVDSTVTSGSTNPVSGNAVYNAIQASSGISYYFDGTDLEITGAVNNGTFSLSGTTLNITVS